MSDPRLVDMEPGGESTQYESIREFTIPPNKQTGQLGDGSPHTKSELSAGVPTTQNGNGNGNKEEENLAQKLGMGGFSEPKREGQKYDTQSDAEAAKTRGQQGYGPGSGVGA